MRTISARKWGIFAAALFMICLLNAEPALAADNWKDHIDPAFEGGSGTENDPWQIATPGQLALLAEKINAGGGENAPYRIGYYTLTGDIDLSAYEWTPIGVATFSWPAFTPVADRSFGGVFDGNGHAISGLYYNSNTEVAVGLFGAVSGGWIMNVSLGADIDIPDGGDMAGRTIGGVAGLLVNGIVESSDVYGAISGGTMPPASYLGSLFSLTGGVAGLNLSGHILASTNTAAVTGAFMTAVNNVLSFTGGIAGQSKGEISGAFNNGTVTGGTYGGSSAFRYAYTGGIAGNIESGAEISNSLNNGSVTGARSGAYSDVGGIVGIMANSSVRTSVNNGSVSGGDAANMSTGGVAGYVYENSALSDVANTGTIRGGTASVANSTGGVAGYNFNTGTIRNVYNFSSVTAGTGGSPVTGGVVGGNAGTIASSYWNSDLSVTGNQGSGSGSGGIAALNSTAFASPSSFAGWSISATPGNPGGNVWFYPAYDPNRPHLSPFFESDGQPLSRVAPNVLAFVVGENGAGYLTLFTGDEIPVISGFGFSSTIPVDGITPSPGGQYDILRLQYANGTVAGKVDGSLLYRLGGQNPGYFLSPFAIDVLPVLEVGGQSRPVKQGDTLTLADPLLLPLTVVGGTGTFAPSLDSASGLTAAATVDETAIRFTGTAGTPGGYAVGIPGTMNGLTLALKGTITILPPDGVPTSGDVVILSLNPPAVTVDTTTSFTAIASRPVAGAALRATLPDGGTETIPVTVSGSTLSFRFTPRQAGTVVLTFTMTEADGSTSVDSVNLTVRGLNGVTVFNLNPTEGVVNTQTAFTAETSRPVATATLEIAWADGSSATVPVTISGSVLYFSLIPTRTGIATLTFTMTEANGTKSVDALRLPVRTQAPRPDLVESVTVDPAPPYQVGDDLKITVKLTRAANVTLSADTPRGTVEPLIATQDGLTATAHYIPDWAGTYRLIVEASDGTDISTATVTFRAMEVEPVRHKGGGGGCDAAGLGILALLLVPVALMGRKKSSR